jgi:hypothetical protein
LLSDFRPHNTVETSREVYGSEHLGIAGIDASMPRFPGHDDGA